MFHDTEQRSHERARPFGHRRTKETHVPPQRSTTCGNGVDHDSARDLRREEAVVLIGFAGLGRMGHPMAANLVRAGHSVLAYDPLPGVVPAGATAVTAAEDLTAASLSISMLPDGPSTLTVVSELL